MDHMVIPGPTPCYGQRHLPLTKAAQCPIQLLLNTSRDGEFTGQPAPVIHHPHSKNISS